MDQKGAHDIQQNDTEQNATVEENSAKCHSIGLDKDTAKRILVRMTLNRMETAE
jgi:hypothetical protein